MKMRTFFNFNNLVQKNGVHYSTFSSLFLKEKGSLNIENLFKILPFSLFSDAFGDMLL